MVFDHLLLNGTMVFDHGSSWSTMVNHGPFRLGNIRTVVPECKFTLNEIQFQTDNRTEERHAILRDQVYM